MSYASEIAADSPVVWYRLQEASGDPQDSSGNGNHVTTTTGTPNYQQASPITSEPSDYSIDLDGDPTYFSAADHATLDLGDVFTMEAWTKRTRTATEETIICKYAAAGGPYCMEILSNDRLALVRTNIGVICSSTNTYTDTSGFHHLAITKNGSTIALYFDGSDVTGTPSNQTFTDSNEGLHIGHQATSLPFVGVLDEVAVYATALSSARISAHYNAATDTSGTPTLRTVRSSQRW